MYDREIKRTHVEYNTGTDSYRIYLTSDVYNVLEGKDEHRATYITAVENGVPICRTVPVPPTERVPVFLDLPSEIVRAIADAAPKTSVPVDCTVGELVDSGEKHRKVIRHLLDAIEVATEA